MSANDPQATEPRRLGFAVKVIGKPGFKSHDSRRWQSEPSLGVSIEALHRILDYLVRSEIPMYRISSDFVPYATHPDLPQFHRQIDEFGEALAAVGRRARDAGVRLSLHPSQYIVLNSEDDSVVEKSMADLRSQADLLDAMGQGPEAVVVLHVGGVYGDHQAARERFVRNFARLPENARSRLVVENDEMSFSVRDCLWISERTGLRVIFDHQHHRLNSAGMDPQEAAIAALRTWPADTTPKMHFSSARLDGREVGKGKSARHQPPLLRQHADYIDPWTFGEFIGSLAEYRFDVMLEAKAKDLALIKLRSDLETLGFQGALRQPARPGGA